MFIFALVLGFIIKLRFPKNTSVRDVIISRYGIDVLQSFRRLEQADLKCRKLAADLHFLETCNINNLTPKFLRFNRSARQLQSKEKYSLHQKDILENEISKKYSCKYSNLSKKDNLSSELRLSTSHLDFNHLISYINNNNEKKENSYIRNHARKLHRLGLRNSFEKLEPDKVIFNYSSRTLSPIEKDALSLGLKFSFNPLKLDYIRHFVAFEKIFSSLKSNPIYRGNIDSLNCLRSSVKQLAFNSYYSFKSQISQQHKGFIKALKRLSSDKSLIVTKPDKGYGIVVLDKTSYIGKMKLILADATKFCRISEEWKTCIYRNQDKVSRFVDELFKKKVINEELKWDLKNSGSRLGILYGSPKVHKRDVPLRPILSMVNSYNFSLSKFLVNLLAPLCNSPYAVKDSFSFAQEIQSFPNNNYCMASFDVVSLFTNIPVNETFSIIENILYNGTDTEHNGLCRKLFKKLFDLCCRDNLFLFDNQLYKQVDGAPMGGCVSPSLAEIFMKHHETIWLDNCPLSFRPVLYKRYVDDTFLLFRSRDHIVPFLNYLNSQHPLIKFTHDVEVNNCLSFLDVKVEKFDNTFGTGLYRKDTFTGLSTKYNSAVPNRYKFNLIQCLVTRAFRICSDFHKFSTETTFLRNYFQQNGFPCSLVNKAINLTADSLRTSIQIPSVEKKSIYCCIPFISHKTNSFIKKSMRDIVSKNYPHLNLRLIFTNSFTVSSFFRFKDRVPTELVSNAVYLFKCRQCSIQYIGETSRHIITRVCDHKGISSRTGRPLTKPGNSRILEHSTSCNHSIGLSDFKVLKTCKALDLKLTESVCIHRFKPDLNNHEQSVPLNILW